MQNFLEPVQLFMPVALAPLTSNVVDSRNKHVLLTLSLLMS